MSRGHRYTRFVYTRIVKNITLTAEEDLIERARLRAAKEKRTLNAAFRDWLLRYAGAETRRSEYDALMKQLDTVRTVRPFSRDERNER